MSLTLRLDPALDARLGHAAIDESTTKTAMIARAVTAMLERHAAAVKESVMSDLTRALRKAEDELTYALVDEVENGPNARDQGGGRARLAGFHESAKQLIIMLRGLAGAMEAYENQECVGQNVGHYATGEDYQLHG